MRFDIDEGSKPTLWASISFETRHLNQKKQSRFVISFSAEVQWNEARGRSTPYSSPSGDWSSAPVGGGSAAGPERPTPSAAVPTEASWPPRLARTSGRRSHPDAGWRRRGHPSISSVSSRGRSGRPSAFAPTDRRLRYDGPLGAGVARDWIPLVQRAPTLIVGVSAGVCDGTAWIVAI